MATKDCPYCDQKGKADSLSITNTNIQTPCGYCIDGHIPTSTDPEQRPGVIARLRNLFTT